MVNAWTPSVIAKIAAMPGMYAVTMPIVLTAAVLVATGISIAMLTWQMAANRMSSAIMPVNRASRSARIQVLAVMPVHPAVVRHAAQRVRLAVGQISASI